MTILTKVEPLTRLRADGDLNKRSARVEDQIADALSLGNAELLQRVAIRGFREAAYLQEEVLVYLIRKFHRAEDDSMVNTLTEILIKRCAKHVNLPIKATLESAYVRDCFQDVIGTVFSQILDIQSDRCDFAQVRFWLWLDRAQLKVMKRYWRKQAEAWETDSIDDDRDEARHDELWRQVEAKRDESANLELAAINREALSILTPEERLLWGLRYRADWAVYSKDPSVMTISKYFGIGERAIRYRVEKIETKLKEWSGGK